MFADWLEERGDARAEGYRAPGTLRRQPNMPSGPGDRCPRFCSAAIPRSWLGEFVEHCHLPGDWFDLIELPGKSAFFAPDHACRTDALRAEVEDAAALAFARLPAERRAALLTPTSAN